MMKFKITQMIMLINYRWWEGIKMRKYIGLSIVACLSLSLAACSGNSSSDASTTAGKVQISTTDRLGNKVELTEPPTSVAALSPGDAETLMELDANVVGVPTMTGKKPASFEGIQEIGNPHSPSLEQIAQVHPTVFLLRNHLNSMRIHLKIKAQRLFIRRQTRLRIFKKTLRYLAMCLKKSSKQQS